MAQALVNRRRSCPVAGPRFVIRAAACALAALAAASCGDSRLPARWPLEPALLWEQRLATYNSADVTGDSVDEILVIYPGRDRSTATVLNQKLLHVGGDHWLTPDIYVDGRCGIWGLPETGPWLNYVLDDTLWLEALWRELRLPVTVGADLGSTPGWDGDIQDAVATDLDLDGRVELCVAVSSGFDRQPRGVFGIDWQAGRLNWEFFCGPLPLDIARVADPPGLVVSTAAVGNGSVAGGTDDSESWVFLLGSGGAERWRRRIGRFSSRVYAEPLGAAGILACEVGSPAGDRAHDSVFVLDPADGSTRRGRQVGGFNVRPLVFTDDGEPRFALWSSDDTLRILDANLEVLHRVGLVGNDRTELVGGDFDGDGREEIAALTGVGSVRICETDLVQVAELPVIGTPRIHRVRGAERDRLLEVRHTNDDLVCRLYEFRPAPLLGSPVPLGWVLAGGIALVIAGLVGFLLLRRRQTGDIRAVIAGLTGRAGVVEFDRHGRVRRCNARARELLGGRCGTGGPLPPDLPVTGLVRSALAGEEEAGPREMPVSLPGGRSLLARATQMRSGVLLSLEDISAVDYLRRVETWLPVAQKLAHGIKNPLTTIGLTAQRLQEFCPVEGEEFVESIRDDVERLRRMTDGFMRFANLEPPKLEPADINAVVRESLARLEAVKPDGIVIRTELADGLPELRLDREQMLVVFGNIVENAVSAMKDRGELVVTTRPVGGGKVEVSFADTGPGIPERYLARVFEPYFTRKPGGTGLGMAISKRIVEDHGGSIGIASEEGKGTTVTIRLPAGQDSGTGMA